MVVGSRSFEMLKTDKKTTVEKNARKLFTVEISFGNYYFSEL